MRIKRKAAAGVRRALAPFGLDVRRQHEFTDIAHFLNLVARTSGYRARVIFDVGANSGSWSKDLSRQLSYKPDFFLFEANREHEKSLLESGYPFFLGVLGSSDASVPFYSRGETGDSIYRELTDRFVAVEPEVREALRLESLVDRHKLPSPNLIKLDTQGSEMDILAGTGAILQSTDLVFSEVAILPYNDGAPLASEFIAFLASHDFLPIRIFEQHQIDSLLVQVDILFGNTSVLQEVLGGWSDFFATRAKQQLMSMRFEG